MIIRIKNLAANTIIGVHDWEKKAPRKLLLNVEMEFAGTRGSDSLADTLDYDKISQMLVAETEKSRLDLIEKLAEILLGKILSDARITRARIEIDKPAAIKTAESVSVVLERKSGA